jgi:hypothetical protein
MDTYDPNDPDPVYARAGARRWYRHPGVITVAFALFILLIAFCAIRVLS